MKHYGKYVRPYLSAFILGPLFMIVEVVGEVVCGQSRHEPNRLAPYREAADAGIEKTNERRPDVAGRHLGNGGRHGV